MQTINLYHPNGLPIWTTPGNAKLMSVYAISRYFWLHTSDEKRAAIRQIAYGLGRCGLAGDPDQPSGEEVTLHVTDECGRDVAILISAAQARSFAAGWM